MKKTNGFTVIEVIFVAVLVGLASILFFVQKNTIEVIARDDKRKIAINAMYYGLEEVYYKTNKYYPQTISSNNLKSVDPDLFTDMNGIKIGEAGSEYTYTPVDCTSNKCKSYSLKTTLENESDYIKTSVND
jgi:type II secretory pathway pseudopilin PulG